MGIIEKQMRLEGSKGTETVSALFDSGASYSCIESELAHRLETVVSLARPLRLQTAKEEELVEVREAIRIDFYLEGYHFSDEFMVIPGLSEQVILGVATMQKWRFKLDMENEEVVIDPRVTRYRLL